MVDSVGVVVEAWINDNLASLREKMGSGQLLHTMGAGQNQYVYSAGFTNSLGYELIVVGMPPDHANPLIRGVGGKLLQRHVNDGDDIKGVASSPLQLRTQSIRDESGAFSMAPGLPLVFGLGLTPIQVRQICWPDSKGRFPGDPGFAHPYRLASDVLFKNGACTLN